MSFHPHRLAPRYSATFAAASRIPGGVEALSLTLGRIAFDGVKATSESPSPADMERVRFVVCGFPRTGTTYAVATLEGGLAQSETGWHTHDVLAIDSYCRAEVPVIITLRTPVDTVASWSTYHGDAPSPSHIKRRLRTYEAWHRRLVRWLPHSGIVGLHFETLTTPPSAHVGARIRQSDATCGIGPMQQHLPHGDRAVLLDAHHDMTTHREVRSALESATDIYHHATALLTDTSVRSVLALVMPSA